MSNVDSWRAILMCATPKPVHMDDASIKGHDLVWKSGLAMVLIDPVRP